MGQLPQAPSCKGGGGGLKKTNKRTATAGSCIITVVIVAAAGSHHFPCVPSSRLCPYAAAFSTYKLHHHYQDVTVFGEDHSN